MYDAYFLDNKHYSLFKNNTKNCINIKEAIDSITSNSKIKTLLYNYFEQDENFNLYDFNNVIDENILDDDDDCWNFDGFDKFYSQNANV